MSRRLTRKEMKRDEILESVGTFVDYVRSHGRLIVVAAVAAALAAVAAGAVAVYLGHRATEADELLARGLAVLEAPTGVEQPRPDDPREPSFADQAARDGRARAILEEVLDRFGRSDAADVARVYLGGMAADAGELDLARRHWERFLERQEDHLLAAEVRVNLMALDRAQGRSEALVDELRARLDRPAGVLPAEVLLHQLGLTLEALGRRDEARQVYERLADEHPASPYAAVAERRSELLRAEPRG